MAETNNTATTTISQADLETIEKLYSFREQTNSSSFFIFRKRENVVNFINDYPFLVVLLLEAHVKIRKHFPKEELFLQVVTDPEMGDNLHLQIVISTKLDVEEAGKKLDQLDDQWWLSNWERGQGKLEILTRFQ